MDSEMVFLGSELRYSIRFPESIKPSIELLANAQTNVDSFCTKLLDDRNNNPDIEPFVRKVQTLKLAALNSGTACLWKADIRFIFANVYHGDEDNLKIFHQLMQW